MQVSGSRTLSGSAASCCDQYDGASQAKATGGPSCHCPPVRQWNRESVGTSEQRTSAAGVPSAGQTSAASSGRGKPSGAELDVLAEQVEARSAESFVDREVVGSTRADADVIRRPVSYPKGRTWEDVDVDHGLVVGAVEWAYPGRACTAGWGGRYAEQGLAGLED
jgi:hypothetical protein